MTPTQIIVRLVVVGVGIVVSFVAIYLGAVSFDDYRANKHGIDNTIALLNLAPLPIPSEQVTLGTTGNAITRSYYLRFALRPSELQLWLQSSPSINTRNPIVISNSHRHLPISAPDITLEDHEFEVPRQFTWWCPSVSKKGRIYRITRPGGCFGTVIVNDESGEVFLEAHTG